MKKLILFTLLVLCALNTHLSSQELAFEWAKQMGGAYGDECHSATIDVAGNVYSTGSFGGIADFDPGPGTFNLISTGVGDAFVSKLDSSGNFLWARQLGGTNDGGGGYSIAVDATGNVYSTGWFMGTIDCDPGTGVYNLTSSGLFDVYISKLDPLGNFLWAKSLGGADYDEGRSLTIDSSGNVYIAGVFQGTADFDPSPAIYFLTSFGADDIFILKLDASGNFLWVKQMGGSGYDGCRSITISEEGNVYSTGWFESTADFNPGPETFSLISEGEGDIFVSCIDPFGNFLWAKQMGGSNNEFGNSLFIDNNGNILITGAFETTADFDPGPGVYNLVSNGNSDIFISKLNGSGDFIWANHVGGTDTDIGTSIAVNDGGDIFTIGYFQSYVDFGPGAGTNYLYSTGGSDVLVLRSDQAGNYLWAGKYGGENNDFGFSISICSNGDIITAGFFTDTTDFNPGNGTCIFNSYGDWDIFLVKLEKESEIIDPPNLIWVKQFQGDFGSDLFSHVALDFEGNIYTTGAFLGTFDFDPGIESYLLTATGDRDIFVTKLTPSGEFVWAKQIGAIGTQVAKGIAVDINGNIVITGWFTGTADFDPGPGISNLTTIGCSDIFILKIDSSGNFLWATSIGGFWYDEGFSIASDSEGNILATGYFQHIVDFDPGPGVANLISSSNSDIFILKLNSSGGFIWAKQFGGVSQPYYDLGFSLCVDGNGNVLSTGTFAGAADFDPGPGSFIMSSALTSLFISKLDSNGNFVWAKQIGGEGAAGEGIAVDIYGNVYTTGGFAGAADFDPGVGSFSLTSTGDWDIFVIKLDPSGNFIWARQMGGPGQYEERGYSIGVDLSGNVYTTGKYFENADFDPGPGLFYLNAPAGHGFFASKLSSSGNFLWAHHLTLGIGYSIALDTVGNFYVTGLSGPSIVTAKYGPVISQNPEIWLAGDLVFGNVPTGATSQQTFTINNSGNADLTVSSISFPSPVFTGNWSGTIPPNENHNVTVTFAPIEEITYSGVVTVNSDAVGGINTITISGVGISNPNYGISASGNLDFGVVQQGSFDDMPVFFYNNTNSIITIFSCTPSPTGAFNAFFPNGTTILPGHSLSASISFFPPGLEIYTATFTVTSDAPNGDITFTATGEGGNDPVSWIGLYNLPENNPEIITLKPLEEHYITAVIVDPVKICADGSRSTIIKFINNDPNIENQDIIFRMKNDPDGNEPDYYGWFIAPYEYTGNTIETKFNHPNYLDVPDLYRNDAIQVVNISNGEIIYELILHIYRAPVVLVHGLWGDMLSMLKVDAELRNSGKYNPDLTRVTDYSNSNSYSFNFNSNVIKNEINNIFLWLRYLKYSAGNVDIVAHSMGGVLSRIYLQNDDCATGQQLNCYRGDIHKLLTLNTPHSGTQMANFILSSATGASLARTILEYNDMPWYNGAVFDLQCNSPAIGSLNGASLNNHIVPCYSVQTDRIPVTTYSSFDEEALANIVAAARVQSVGEFLDEVFNYSPNDLIVPTNSQRGGLNDFSFIEDVKHTASPDNPLVIGEVRMLLDENPVNSVHFDGNTEGFDPPVIPPTFFFEGSDPNKGNRNEDIAITNPTSGFTCSEGDEVQIDVVGSSNIDQIFLTVGNINTGISSFDTLTNSATFYYTVPDNMAGAVKIMAIGFNETGFVDLDTLEIYADPMASLDSISFVNNNINIPIGQSVPFSLFGYFSDSTIRNLTMLNNISFDIADTDIATLGLGNILNGVSIGETYMRAAYQNKNAFILVNVYPGDDWVINSVEKLLDSDKKEILYFDVFPNPAGEYILFKNELKSKSTYAIYGMLGNPIVSGLANEGINHVNIEKIAAGVYIIQLFDGNKIYVTKFIKQ